MDALDAQLAILEARIDAAVAPVADLVAAGVHDPGVRPEHTGHVLLGRVRVVIVSHRAAALGRCHWFERVAVHI